MKKLLVPLCALLVAGSAAVVQAKDKPPKAPKTPKKPAIEAAFEKFDADSNRQISEDEFCTKNGKPLDGNAKELALKNFKKWDTDNDKQLSLDEFKAKGAKPKTPK